MGNKNLVRQYQYPVSEPTGKRDKPVSQLNVTEMVNRSLEKTSERPNRIWVSRVDVGESFVTDCGLTAEPKGGVPVGQVWLFVQEGEV